jgi:poly-gamma-glutamate capsule biosynthesis protein CapA/YwtB (metallophosphatase superfamily)
MFQMKSFAPLIFAFLVVGVAEAQDTTRLSLLFLGDIMQHDSQINDAYNPVTGKHDYRPCFQFVKPYTQPVDVAIGNLEVTLAGPPHKGYPQFSAPDELLSALKDMGLDVLVTANNHCVDRGRQGLERTVQMLDSFKILHTGTFVDSREREKLTPLLVEKNGFRLALLNYTYGTNGLPVYKPNIVNLLDTALMRRDLTLARSLNPDLIIVFTHWGSEYQSLPSVGQRKLTEFCFKNGASIVIGAHPHVIQPMEWNKNENKLIAYSLGNFVSGQRKRYTDGGAMIRMELEKITQPDNTSSTKIDTAGYILQWVHRTVDQEKNYFLYPVPTIESNIKKYVRDAASVEAFHTFVSDSRTLLNTHNKSIAELNSAPEFSLQMNSDQADTLSIRNLIEDAGEIRMMTDYPSGKFQIGPFTLPDANHIRIRIEPVPEVIRRKD